MDLWLTLTAVDIDHLIPIARTAEQLGFAGVSLGDHLLYPMAIGSRYPYASGSDGQFPFTGASHWPDVWVAIAAMATATESLKFKTGVHIASLRHPIHLAKSLGTASRLSAGRVLAGFGAGWLREEFDILGVPFEQRGARTDEVLEATRSLLTGEMVSFDGKYYHIPPVQMSPAPTASVPFLIGGHTDVALRRAARHEGFVGVHFSMEETVNVLMKLTAYRHSAGSNRSFYTMMNLGSPSRQIAKELADIGVDAIIFPLSDARAATSLEAELDAVRRIGEEMQLHR